MGVVAVEEVDTLVEARVVDRVAGEAVAFHVEACDEREVVGKGERRKGGRHVCRLDARAHKVLVEIGLGRARQERVQLVRSQAVQRDEQCWRRPLSPVRFLNWKRPYPL